MPPLEINTKPLLNLFYPDCLICPQLPLLSFTPVNSMYILLNYAPVACYLPSYQPSKSESASHSMMSLKTTKMLVCKISYYLCQTMKSLAFRLLKQNAFSVLQKRNHNIQQFTLLLRIISFTKSTLFISLHLHSDSSHYIILLLKIILSFSYEYACVDVCLSLEARKELDSLEKESQIVEDKYILSSTEQFFQPQNTLLSNHIESSV